MYFTLFTDFSLQCYGNLNNVPDFESGIYAAVNPRMFGITVEYWTQLAFASDTIIPWCRKPMTVTLSSGRTFTALIVDTCVPYSVDENGVDTGFPPCSSTGPFDYSNGIVDFYGLKGTGGDLLRELSGAGDFHFEDATWSVDLSGPRVN
jgi:hypothetical protein